MRVENNCVVDMSPSDKHLECCGQKHPIIKGYIHSGVLKFFDREIHFMSGTFHEPGANYIVYVPQDGKLVEKESPDLAYSFMEASIVFTITLADIGKIERICFTDNTVTARINEKIQFKLKAINIDHVWNYKYSGENIQVEFIDQYSSYYGVTPFGKTPLRTTDFGTSAQSDFPAVTIKAFGIHKLVRFTKAVKTLDDYDGKQWPGTDVPIIMKPFKSGGLVVDEKGVYYVHDGEIVSTVFISPTRPTKIEKGEHSAKYHYGPLEYEVKYEPSIDDFVSNLTAAEILTEIGDVVSEFNLL